MNNKHKVVLPYFDYLLAGFKNTDDALETSFGRHVHWGYWQRPETAKLTAGDFAAAAENLSARVCAAAEIADAQRILDVGCGFGGTIAYLNENYTTLELFGLNLDVRQLLRAQTLVKSLAGNEIQFQQGNAVCLPFADDSFDVVLAVECIFHFPDRRQFFQEARRVLKPGGSLVLSDFVPAGKFAPLTKINLPKPLPIGFFGQCNIQCTVKDYHAIATTSGFATQYEEDITVNTLPTYSYLRKLGLKLKVYNVVAILETLTIELTSRLRLIKYYVFAFRKR